jgi:hypothetical protein
MGLSVSQSIAACNLAFMFYLRTVKCIQRSAATAAILRRNGHAADLTVGVRSLPFFSHAWVQVDGVPVNENSEMLRTLRVIDSF